MDAIDRAVENGDYDHARVVELLDRSFGRPGAAALAAAVAEWEAPAAFYRSKGERALHRVIARGVPLKPKVNCFVAGYERDFYWENPPLVVELDGWDGHKTRDQQERDRVRDATAIACRIPVLRITGRRAYHDPDGVVADIRAALGLAE